jgi:pilus assembly protein CpaB
MKNTTVGLMVAVLLAAGGTYFLVDFVRGAEERALAGQETVDVLVLNENVARGTSAEDLAQSVSVERIPAKVRANGSVDTLDALAGQVAGVDLVAGEQVVAGRFVTPAQFASSRGIDVPEGLQQITISLAPQRALGGQIAPGDIVGVFGSFLIDNADGTQQEVVSDTSIESSKVILHKLLVTNVQVEQLPQAPSENDGETSGPSLAPTGNLLITLAVDVPQAERIVFASEYGTIWLTAQSQETNEAGSRIRNLRNIYDE